jgi:hypothetical protein
VRSHRGGSHVFYLDVSLDESLRRHATRPQAADFTGAEMRSWYLPRVQHGSCRRAGWPGSCARYESGEGVRVADDRRGGSGVDGSGQELRPQWSRCG